MARISTYAIDPIVTSNDKWIGTDFSGGITKNFTPQKLADFFNESGILGVANQINFKYYQTFIGDRPVGSITTLTQAPTFSSLTNIKVSEKNSGLKYIVDILNTFLGDTIMIANTSNPNLFGVYKLTAIEEDLSNLGFYNLSLEFIEQKSPDSAKTYNLNSNEYGEIIGKFSLNDQDNLDLNIMHKSLKNISLKLKETI